MVKGLISTMEDLGFDSREGDLAFCLLDMDCSRDKEKPLQEALRLAKKNEIQIIVSNPCFEFWYLLHFQYTTKFFKDYPAVKTALTAYLSDYEKAGDVYAQLSEHTTDAIQNAKRVEQYHIQNDCNKPFGIAVNPFTDIYQLVESLL